MLIIGYKVPPDAALLEAAPAWVPLRPDIQGRSNAIKQHKKPSTAIKLRSGEAAPCDLRVNSAFCELVY